MNPEILHQFRSRSPIFDWYLFSFGFWVFFFSRNHVKIGFLVSKNIKIHILHMFLCCLVRKICIKKIFNFDGGHLEFLQFKPVKCSEKNWHPNFFHPYSILKENQVINHFYQTKDTNIIFMT